MDPCKLQQMELDFGARHLQEPFAYIFFRDAACWRLLRYLFIQSHLNNELAVL